MKIYCLKGLKSFFENNERVINNFIMNDFEGSAKFFAYFMNTVLFVEEDGVIYDSAKFNEIRGDIEAFMEDVEEIDDCFIMTYNHGGNKERTTYLPICAAIKEQFDQALKAGENIKMTTLKEYNSTPVVENNSTSSEEFDEEKAIDEINEIMSKLKDKLSSDSYKKAEQIINEVKALGASMKEVRAMKDGEFKDICLNSVREAGADIMKRFKQLIPELINDLV